ncbi:MAG: hypothetical protein GWN58_02600, partial [Anaerolineae bacterium]|nr:hypothetical protein [Anaerolineae bacterium]
YQNDDGGFGNGLEADLLCPDSTAIGAETALFVLEMLDIRGGEMVERLANWVVASQEPAGVIPHPPKGLFDYPFQPWWSNPDDDRVLVIAALLKKQGLEHELFFEGVRRYYLTTRLPAPDHFYGYPHLAYVKHCGKDDADRADLATMVEGLPVLLEEHRDHYPLFSRYWFYAADLVDREVLFEQAGRFVAGLQEDGGVATPYPDLPWWRPIFTLDGMILLKRCGLL